MLESRNFYLTSNAKVKDFMLDAFEAKADVLRVKNALIDIGAKKLNVSDVRQALIMSYCDAGESEKALELAYRFNAQEPSANMHNLILKVLLSSWSFTQPLFLEESRKWAALYAHENEVALPVYRNARSRIGLVCDYGSTTFGENAIFPMSIAFMFSGFDVFYYNFEKTKISAEIDHFVIKNVYDKSSQQLSNIIKADQIDILIDLNGRLREHHRLGVFSRRSAPIQVNYFNLVGTMGMKNYDYIIVDDVQVPVGDEKYYVEKSIRLPCGVNGAFSFKRDVEISTDEKSPAAPFVYASFNAFFKVNTTLLEAWSEILRRTTNTKLVIKCAETDRDRVIKKIANVFSRTGVDLNRIMIEGWSTLSQLRKQYASVDVCLDTFPYSGGSTTLNALWQGVPVITLQGDGWRTSTASSMLKAGGMDEFVANSREAYIEKAVWLASNRGVIREWRQHLKGHVNENPYFQPGLVYRQIGDAFHGLLEKHKGKEQATV